jgi:hypothetical protein
MPILLAVVLACTAFLLSFSNDAKVWLHTTGRFHAAYHLALFATLGLLAMRSSTNPLKRSVFLAAAVLLGMGIEYTEAARFQSVIEWNDVRTDTAGVALGAVLGWLLSGRSSYVRISKVKSRI